MPLLQVCIYSEIMMKRNTDEYAFTHSGFIIGLVVGTVVGTVDASPVASPVASPDASSVASLIASPRCRSVFIMIQLINLAPSSGL